MSVLYPWLEKNWQALADMSRQGRLPHALLLSGPRGTGKGALAEQLTRSMLCRQTGPDGYACGQCPSCAQFSAGSHPDYLAVRPGEDSSFIKVDQVRALSEALSLCAHGQGFKVSVISPAEAMNINAANSLLKTLEEPSDNTVLVLVSERPALLPATIRSRCQQVRVNMPDYGLALNWLSGQLPDVQQAEACLRLAAGAPLAALELAGGGVIEARSDRFEQLVDIFEGRITPVEAAQAWSKDEGMQGIRWLRDWLMDMLRIRMTGQQQAVRSVDIADRLAGLASRLDSRVMFTQLDRVNRVLANGAGSLNQQMLTEDILIAWANGR